MRILLVHNSYRTPGGEDRAFSTEARVLSERGHDVVTYARKNPGGAAAAVRLAGQAFWNRHVYQELSQLIRRTRPDVVHLHNTFPLISPAACYAAHGQGVPTVQTLHNYRLLCPNALFLRAGKPCEDCVHTRVPWPAVIHACYRDSYAGSMVTAGALVVHRTLRTWATQVDTYIAPTEFARRKFIEGGFDAGRIVVKPNLVHPDPGAAHGTGRFALFVGRLSREKGILTLLAALPRIAARIPLVIAGDGPLAAEVRRAIAHHPHVSWLGHKSPEEVHELMGSATCLIVPSICYETFGLVIAEAFARGTPVVAARLGALTELVDHERTGLHFTPGDHDDLGRQVEWMVDNAGRLASMRAAARAEYERRYSAESNYAMLRQIYADAIAAARTPARALTAPCDGPPR